VYGTTDLAGNFRQGMSSLTQPSLFASSTPYCDQSTEN